jgi:1,5-anhydro-D-fructose reductase (1,5-anhydro-D-mannitol-forming)
MIQNPGGAVTLRTAAGEEELMIEHRNLYENTLLAVDAAIAGTAGPLCTGEDGVWSLATGLAVVEAARTGGTVKIAPGL